MFAAISSGASIDVTGAHKAGGAISNATEEHGLSKWLATVRKHHEGTHQHCLLVTGLATDFGLNLGFPKKDIERLYSAAMFHDLGKATISLAVLDKPGRLDDRERALIGAHPGAGYDVLLYTTDVARRRLQRPLPYAGQARETACLCVQGGCVEPLATAVLFCRLTTSLAAIADDERGIYAWHQQENAKDAAMPAPLDPVVAQIIPLLPLRDPTTMTPQSARDALRALAAARATVPPPPVAEVRDIKVKGGAGPLAARVYRPAPGKSPTVVFFHGGGWVAGDLETHDRQARWLAIETGAVIVSVDYRRPPETRFPGAFEDAFAAVKDVADRIGEFGGDADRVGVAGDSAGGNLAATTAIACRDSGIKLAAQLLVYPVTDVFGSFADATENARFPSRVANAEGYFLSRAVMEWFCGHYLADKAHGIDWRVSPLRAKDHAGLAPAIVCTAWFDPLRDEGIAYAAALEAAGVPTRHYRGEGLIHGYFGLGEASEAARAEARRARADFKALLHR